MELRLSEEIFREIESVSRQVAPGEAVGLLAGEGDGTVKRVFPLSNIARLGSFLADPYEQFLAERAITDAGLHLLAIFHSHPWGGATLSADDVRFAKNWTCAHAVFAFQPDSNDHGELCAYEISGNTIVEVEVKIDR
jgi:proteasome lid subunit RPN8/RPN11